MLQLLTFLWSDCNIGKETNPLSQLFSYVLLNSDSASAIRKQQFEISLTDGAKRKLENLQDSLILKHCWISLWTYEYTYLAYLSNNFFSHFTVLSSCNTYWSRKRWELTHVLRKVRGGEKNSVMHIKIRNLYGFFLIYSFVKNWEIGENIHYVLSTSEL